MDLPAVIGLSLAAAVLSIVLRQYKAEYAAVLSLVTGAAVLIAVIKAMEPVVGDISEMVSVSGLSNENASVVLKVVGVGFITQLACDSCRDAGESAIASKIELAGRMAVLLLAIPVFRQVFALVSSLFGLN